MKTIISPVNFKNNNGLRLFGILHSPDKPRTDVAIIILSPGIKNRVAPHRLYYKMAKQFCKMGFMILRFDPEGLGDSEGRIDHEFTADLYGSIQVGRFIDDTISAMDWMEKKYNIHHFILSGLCGGAITGLLTGARDRRVDSLLSLGIPVILDSTNIDQTQYITRGQLGRLYEGYIKKLFDLKSWLRFLTFQSDYRLMFKSFMQQLGNNLTRNKNKADNKNTEIKESPEPPAINFNPYFVQAFMKIIQNRKILLIFSGSDRLYWEFEEKFEIPYRQLLEKYNSNFEIHTAKDANHVFTFLEWQEDMLRKSCSWLNQHYQITQESFQ